MATPEELLTESYEDIRSAAEDLLEGISELAAEGLLRKERRELKGIRGNAAIKCYLCQDYQDKTKTI